MRMLFQVTGLFLVLLISGCTSITERAGIDVKKAAVSNAELGVAYLRQGKYEVAMNKLKKAIAYDEDNTNANHYIAILYGRLNENELAIKYFEKALDLDDEDSSIKNNYGIFLCGTSSYEKGLSFLKVALEDPLYADKGQAYENMGLCAEKQGNIQKAEKYFTTALTYNKKSPSALLGLAQIAFDKRNIKASSAYLERHNAVAQPTPQSMWLEILIARKQGYKGRAGSVAMKLRQYFPDSVEVKYLEKLNIR